MGLDNHNWEELGWMVRQQQMKQEELEKRPHWMLTDQLI